MAEEINKNISSLKISILIAVAVRIAIFIFAIWSPIINEFGEPISPVLQQKISGDIGAYLDAKEQYFDSKKSSPSIILKQIKPGPMHPFLLYIFNYKEGNTIPLAILFLLVSIMLVCLWLYWLFQQGVSLKWLLVFSIIPNPIWFTLLISTDLIFALLFGLFFILYFKNNRSRGELAFLGGVIVLMFLLRPNSVSVLLFIVVDYIYKSREANNKTNIKLMSMMALLAVASVFYYPYFIEYLKATYPFTFFGFSTGEYINGLFNNLPLFINYFLSWVCLFFAKVLYFVGLRPSYANVALLKVALRGCIGLILLPGILYLFWRGDVRHKVLVAIFMAPILLGASQDRYNLPIQPLLFFYGVIGIKNTWNYLRNKSNTATLTERTPSSKTQGVGCLGIIKPASPSLSSLTGGTVKRLTTV